MKKKIILFTFVILLVGMIAMIIGTNSVSAATDTTTHPVCAKCKKNGIEINGKMEYNYYTDKGNSASSFHYLYCVNCKKDTGQHTTIYADYYGRTGKWGPGDNPNNCTLCKAQKPSSCEHSWGEWTKKSGTTNTHIRTCSKCPETETHICDVENIDYTTYTKNSNQYHKKTCNIDGCNIVITDAKCVDNNGDAFCDTCKNVMTQLLFDGKCVNCNNNLKDQNTEISTFDDSLSGWHIAKCNKCKTSVNFWIKKNGKWENNKSVGHKATEFKSYCNLCKASQPTATIQPSSKTCAICPAELDTKAYYNNTERHFRYCTGSEKHVNYEEHTNVYITKQNKELTVEEQVKSQHSQTYKCCVSIGTKENKTEKVGCTFEYYSHNTEEHRLQCKCGAWYKDSHHFNSEGICEECQYNKNTGKREGSQNDGSITDNGNDGGNNGGNNGGATNTGWKQKNSAWYYYESGNMVTGWKKLSYNGQYGEKTNWYYFATSNNEFSGYEKGQMILGDRKIGGIWYYFCQYTGEIDGYYAGAMLQNAWHIENSEWYYYGASGQMLTGWQYLSYSGDLGEKTNWYYFATSGTQYSGFKEGQMIKGRQEVGGKYYYFCLFTGEIDGYYSGAMLQNQWYDNYYYDETGAWVENAATPTASATISPNITLTPTNTAVQQPEQECVHDWKQIWTDNEHWTACLKCGQWQEGTAGKHTLNTTETYEDGTRKIACSGCGYYFIGKDIPEASGSSCALSGNNHTPVWCWDAIYHRKICSTCGEILLEENHNFIPENYSNNGLDYRCVDCNCVIHVRGFSWGDHVTGVYSYTSYSQLLGEKLAKAEFHAEIVTDGKIYENAANAIDKNIDKFVVYNISLDNDGEDIQLLEEKMKITIPIPEGYDTNKMAVYGISENGEKILYKTIIENGKIVIYTDYLTSIVIAETKEKTNEANIIEANATHNTTATIGITVIVAIVIAAVIIFISIYVVKAIGKRKN